MSSSSTFESFREAPWLTRRRLVAYPKLFLFVYVASAVLWLMHSKGLIDPAGHPIGADFIDPWSASWLTQNHAPWEVYNVQRLWAAERMAVSDPAVGFAGFHYPPTYLIFVLPLALLPYAWSLLIWTVGTLAAYLAVMWMIDPEPDSIWLAIAFPGALVNLTNGQNGFLTLALLAMALLTVEEQPYISGILFGLMSYKPQYGVLVPIFLIATGRWKTILSAAITVAAMCVISLAMFGAGTWNAFFASFAFTRHVVLEQGGSGFEKLQSAFAAARLWGFGVTSAYVVQAIVSLFTALVAIWIWRQRTSFILHAAALATGVLLVTPYIMDYDLVMLALPIAWIAIEGRRSEFLPWEKSLLAFAWLLPLFARSLAGHAYIPITPFAMLLVLADIARRAGLEEARTEAVA